MMCPYCHADKRTEITYDCWTKVGDDELARSERCLRNEIRQLKERISNLEDLCNSISDCLQKFGKQLRLKA
jgi:hypothetical protein